MHSEKLAAAFMVIMLFLLFGCGLNEDKVQSPPNYVREEKDFVHSANFAKDIAYAVIKNKLPRDVLGKYSYKLTFNELERIWEVGFYNKGIAGGYTVKISAIDGSMKLECVE